MHDQGADDHDELGRARRRAFSRGATTDDLARLRELEERAATATSVFAHDRADAAPGPAPSEAAEAEMPESDVDDPPRRSDRAWIRPAALGAIAGALVALVVATLTSPLFWARTPESLTEYTGAGAAELGPSLAIFDRTPSERDILGAASFPELFDPDSGTPEVRWLADVEQATVYVARGERDGSTAICLLAIRAASAGGSCASVPEFEVAGIGGTFEGVAVRWGPYGVAPWLPYTPEPQ